MRIRQKVRINTASDNLKQNNHSKQCQYFHYSKTKNTSKVIITLVFICPSMTTDRRISLLPTVENHDVVTLKPNEHLKK